MTLYAHKSSVVFRWPTASVMERDAPDKAGTYARDINGDALLPFAGAW